MALNIYSHGSGRPYRDSFSIPDNEIREFKRVEYTFYHSKQGELLYELSPQNRVVSESGMVSVDLIIPATVIEGIWYLRRDVVLCGNRYTHAEIPVLVSYRALDNLIGKFGFKFHIDQIGILILMGSLNPLPQFWIEDDRLMYDDSVAGPSADRVFIDDRGNFQVRV